MSKYLSKFVDCVNTSGHVFSNGGVTYESLYDIVSDFDHIAIENEIDDVDFESNGDFIIMKLRTSLLSDYENRDRLSKLFTTATKFEVEYNNEECDIAFYFR